MVTEQLIRSIDNLLVSALENVGRPPSPWRMCSLPRGISLLVTEPRSVTSICCFTTMVVHLPAMCPAVGVAQLRGVRAAQAARMVDGRCRAANYRAQRPIFALRERPRSSEGIFERTGFLAAAPSPPSPLNPTDIFARPASVSEKLLALLLHGRVVR